MPHARFMKPFCRMINIDREATDKLLKQEFLVLVMPYLHWETRKAYEDMLKVIDKVKQRSEPRSNHQGGKPKSLEIPDTTFQDDREQIQIDRKLIQKYLSGSSLHIRRTLDQSYYYTLADTRLRDRDKDQVVYRYTKQLRNNSEKTPDTSPLQSMQLEPLMLMVDQCWLWILDGDTLLTCFPQRWGQDVKSKDETDVFQSIFAYLEPQEHLNRIMCVQDLAFFIIDRCAGNVLNPSLTRGATSQFLEIFSKSIGALADKQTSRFRELMSQVGLEGGNLDDLFDVYPEFTLLDEIRDVIEELSMIENINTQQTEAMEELKDKRPDKYGNSRPTRRPRHLYAPVMYPVQLHSRSIGRRATVESLFKSAHQVLQLLDLKQKQANVSEARSARKFAEETEKQGQSILLFTVVTIFFLPMSTLASIFGLNAKQLNKGEMSLGIVFAYIFPISLLVFAASLYLGFKHRMLQTFSRPPQAGTAPKKPNRSLSFFRRMRRSNPKAEERGRDPQV
ncbi:hypothetical protein W97_05580 [Coniosporium apollinis CBS 100218]|uniref:Uncharacterized protein n=1 Tax=Coniosporium apollinis (strain CBS 100218) TaxID=1168221 RepID=R7YX53_CONA1|nr:uncharacterized protein W97_05580 [Coniosporium apollinis CBS 100218]EON66482.1 hypothetical protein W97_05580 [Coniosporium apollinis CBS 100218]